MPCILPDEEHFKFGVYGDNVAEKEYEQYLNKKYGYEMYCMSGVHLNFSINEKYYKELKRFYKNIPETLEDAYFKIIRNYLKKVWMLIALFGATPKQYGENSYETKCSIRNSNKQGFKNLHLDPINYENKVKHIESLRKNIANKNIISISELYTPIRIKGKWKYNIDDLANNPISHIEVRVLDLNPFDKTTVPLEEMDFVVGFLFHCLLQEEKEEKTYNYRDIAETGITEEHKKLLYKEINDILKVSKELDLGFEKSLKKIQKDLKEGNSPSEKITRLFEEKGYINALMELAKKYNEEARDGKYAFVNLGKKIYNAPSALLRDAILRGVDYRVLEDRDNNSIIEFKKHGKKEYIVGATQTRKDNYIVHYLTNDKFQSKEILQKAKLRTPRGIMISDKLSEEQLEDLYENYEEK